MIFPLHFVPIPFRFMFLMVMPAILGVLQSFSQVLNGGGEIGVGAFKKLSHFCAEFPLDIL